MDNDVVLFTACDQRFFPSCIDLIESIRAARGSLPRMRVLDVGMLPAQASELAGMVEAVIAPGWDVGGGRGLPEWYRAMTARPYLPNYAPGAAMIAWIDCDAWVQRWEPLKSLVAAARDGRLAIVEEKLGRGFVADLPSDPGTVNKFVVTPDSIRANVRSCYRLCFGNEIAAAYGNLPPYNVGVFALRADSPTWTIWRDLYGSALNRAFHRMAEQQALTVAIRQGRVPIASQPQEVNFICGADLPWFSAEQGVFTMPKDAARLLAVVHLTDTKDYPVLRIPHHPDGVMKPMPLTYREFQRYLKGGIEALALPADWMQLVNRWAGEPAPIALDPARPETWGKVGRNEPCPCGSGLRYKQCHGKLA